MVQPKIEDSLVRQLFLNCMVAVPTAAGKRLLCLAIWQVAVRLLPSWAIACCMQMHVAYARTV